MHSRIGSLVGRTWGSTSESVLRAHKKYQTSVAVVLERSRRPELRRSVELEWSGGGRVLAAVDSELEPSGVLELVGPTPQCDAAL